MIVISDRKYAFKELVGLISLSLVFLYSSASYAKEIITLYSAESSSYSDNYNPSNLIDDDYYSKMVTDKDDLSPWWRAKTYKNNSSNITIKIITQNPSRIDNAVVSLLDNAKQEIDTRVIKSNSKDFEYEFNFKGIPYGAAEFVQISKDDRYLEMSEVIVSEDENQNYSNFTNPYFINIVKNNNASEGNLSEWETSGDNWSAVIDGKDSGFQIDSTSWHRKSQIIDLVASGFSPEILDMQPSIVFSEQFSNHSGLSEYSLNIKLLDESFNVIKQWKSGIVKHDDDMELKDQISSKITHYGSGLRFIEWEDSGYKGKLEDQVLFIMPPNILNQPDRLDSWNTTGSFRVIDGSEGSSFETSQNWATREQVVDLNSLGYSEYELETNPPIIVSSRYGKKWYPDFFRLEIIFLDDNYIPFKSWDSGLLQNQTSSHSSEQYEDALVTVFNDYDGSRLRYIKWRETGKSFENSDDYLGVVMKDPYLGVSSIHPGDNSKLSLLLASESSSKSNRSVVIQSSFFSHLVKALELSAITLLGCNPVSLAASSGGLCVGAVAIDAAIIATSVIRSSESFPSYKVKSSNDTSFSKSWCLNSRGI